jgi:catechol 2,3-dioxygenase
VTRVEGGASGYRCNFASELDRHVTRHADFDGIGVELYRDRPRDQWPEQMTTLPLDVRALLAEASG